ncbi:hypothetical protein [Joostella sp.]|uniref:hypothetical protein n=1 Tax=Joostella sp. TaxID=2231138 RepID=UPI003A8CDE15
MANVLNKGAKIIGFASKFLKKAEQIDKYAKTAQVIAKAMKQVNLELEEIWNNKKVIKDVAEH